MLIRLKYKESSCHEKDQMDSISRRSPKMDLPADQDKVERFLRIFFSLGAQNPSDRPVGGLGQRSLPSHQDL